MTSYELERFVAAQEGVYGSALAELEAGKKVGHWMWFVFPQVVGLGHSPLADRFAIRSIGEARAYLAHPLLGRRLRACAAALLQQRGRSARQIMGDVDALKLRSCMTLFAAIDAPDGEFYRVIERYFRGTPDPLTTATLAKWRAPAGAGPAEGGSPEPDATTDMWEQPEVVERFAQREPDHRLVGLLSGAAAFGAIGEPWAPGVKPTVLDLGCAGGRNTLWLANFGADVYAVDASHAMVAETRKRLAAVMGAAEANRRVTRGFMDDLTAFPSGMFDVVVALGVLQAAQAESEWRMALAAVARVLHSGGLALVANFGPDSAPDGTPLTRVSGTRHVWSGFGAPDRHMTLPDLEALDADFLRHGLTPALPTESVRVPTPRGHRTTLNALYRKT